MRMPSRGSLVGLFLLAITLLIPGAASAQTGAASLTGIVTDQSGAAVILIHKGTAPDTVLASASDAHAALAKIKPFWR